MAAPRVSRWGAPLPAAEPAPAAPRASRWGAPVVSDDAGTPSEAAAAAPRAPRWGAPLPADDAAAKNPDAAAPRASRWGAPVQAEASEPAADAPRRSRWAEADAAEGEQAGSEADLKKAMEMAAMRAEALADFRSQQKQRADAKGKGKSASVGAQLESEPSCKWAQDWRRRIMDALPHGNDICASVDVDSMRPILLELWHDVTSAANGEATAALSVFAADDGGSSAAPLISDGHAGSSLWSVTQAIPTEAASAPSFGTPKEEVARIWPGEGAPLVAPTAVLRLTGRNISEEEVTAAYKRLSRVVHPDKTGDLPGATDAFKRVSDSVEELRSGIKAAREVVQRIEFVMGFRASEDESLQRPHAKLFAVALRFLLSVIGLSGEGKCTQLIKQRAAVAFEKAVGPGSSTSVTNAWFQSPALLGTFGTQMMRTTFECAPKQFRAQFVCTVACRLDRGGHGRAHARAVGGHLQDVSRDSSLAAPGDAAPRARLGRSCRSSGSRQVASLSLALAEPLSASQEPLAPSAQPFAPTQPQPQSVAPSGSKSLAQWRSPRGAGAGASASSSRPCRRCGFGREVGLHSLR
eukprot:TRINITY_DN23918_c0_g1_i1.p1 TRINITY_DN23918_c0_g1~~TRINITY_DN23918_c0_g1_i1.p1  ORF type:complete len:598 (-),score=106.59 TRINITY_DN23918_c0_g1_i1:488-2224(-)